MSDEKEKEKEKEERIPRVGIWCVGLKEGKLQKAR